MPTNVVITMAGRGSRFLEAGYVMPKYEIMAHGKSLFDWSLLSLKNFITADSRVIFICLEENNSFDFIHQRCSNLGLRDVRIIVLKEVTDGQATSAYESREDWLIEQPLLIYNIDTHVNPNMIRPDHIRTGSDGWVPCFQVSGDHWSFVKLDENNWAEYLAEKKRISNFASIGLYWFANADFFRRAYEKYFADSNRLVGGERYIAPLYNQLISDGLKVSITDLPFNDVNVLGTPKELNIFLRKKFDF